MIGRRSGVIIFVAQRPTQIDDVVVLDVVVGKRVATNHFNIPVDACTAEALFFRRDAILDRRPVVELDFAFDVVDRIIGIHAQEEPAAPHRLHNDLHGRSGSGSASAPIDGGGARATGHHLYESCRRKQTKHGLINERYPSRICPWIISMGISVVTSMDVSMDMYMDGAQGGETFHFVHASHNKSLQLGGVRVEP